MVCRNCDSPISYDFIYCPYCGNRVKPYKYLSVVYAALIVVLCSSLIYCWYTKDTYYFEKGDDRHESAWQEYRMHKAIESLKSKRDSLVTAPVIGSKLFFGMSSEEVQNTSNFSMQKKDSLYNDEFIIESDIDIFPSEYGSTPITIAFFDGKFSEVEAKYHLNGDAKQKDEIEKKIIASAKSKYGRKYIEYNKDWHFQKGYPSFSNEIRKDRIYVWFYHNQIVRIHISDYSISLVISRYDVKNEPYYYW